MKGIGIIGCGHWGKNYLRVFKESREDIVVSAYDCDQEKLKNVSSRYSWVKISHNIEDILKDELIEAVAISTPATTHYELVKKALLSNKHVLVEKPFTLKSDQAKELVELSEERKLALMVSHTFLYNSAIRQIKRYIDNGECGKIYYLKATRTHLGLIREDVNAFWDLAPHDISIFNYLLGAMPIKVSVVGSQVIREGREDVGFATLFYPHNVIANIHVSWIDSHKEREVSIVAARQRIVFDDLNNLEKIRIFEKGIEVEREISNFGEFQLLLRDGNIVSPKVSDYEPLKKQCEHFLECVEQKKMPLTDGKNGFEIVKILEAFQESLAKNGEPVKVEEGSSYE
ncbi:MAG: Gfo/Idh/MocA family oxidoreductase [Candidatus Omnitrophica bacterium]|nr:Gfo/Idh/MocA family oxidoreductase [Candidatus Omnitrophota bacterium]